MSDPYRVDPIDCGCTDCLVGVSVSLASVSRQQVADLLNGALENATMRRLGIAVSYVLQSDEEFPSLRPERIRVQVLPYDDESEEDLPSWELDPYQLHGLPVNG
ncbi:hypothetical protein [Streptomyces atratus]|uniref:hypothetical protein n=1 Tax=Streptomyces atratus TaxID=1893 RepID=UPI0033FB97DB